MLNPCKECGKEVSDKAVNCPHCGAALKKSEMEKFVTFMAVMLSILAVVYFMAQGYK